MIGEYITIVIDIGYTTVIIIIWAQLAVTFLVRLRAQSFVSQRFLSRFLDLVLRVLDVTGH